MSRSQEILAKLNTNSLNERVAGKNSVIDGKNIDRGTPRWARWKLIQFMDKQPAKNLENKMLWKVLSSLVDQMDYN